LAQEEGFGRQTQEWGWGIPLGKRHTTRINSLVYHNKSFVATADTKVIDVFYWANAISRKCGISISNTKRKTRAIRLK
jgi:hypothetical protein